MPAVLGLLEYTEAAGRSYRWYGPEEMTHMDAWSRVSNNFPEMVEFAPDDDTHWFYRDEDAEKRDENNADHNAGVVAIWRVLKADDINEDEVEEYINILREKGDPLAEEIADAVQRDFSEAQKMVLAYKNNRLEDK